MTVIHAESRFQRAAIAQTVADFTATHGDIPVTQRKAKACRLSAHPSAARLVRIIAASQREYPAVAAMIAIHYDDKSGTEATIFIDADAAVFCALGDTPKDAQIDLADETVMVTFEGSSTEQFAEVVA